MQKYLETHSIKLGIFADKQNLIKTAFKKKLNNKLWENQT